MEFVLCHNFSKCCFYLLALKETWLSLKNLVSPTGLLGDPVVALYWVKYDTLHSLSCKAPGESWLRGIFVGDLEDKSEAVAIVLWRSVKCARAIVCPLDSFYFLGAAVWAPSFLKTFLITFVSYSNFCARHAFLQGETFHLLQVTCFTNCGGNERVSREWSARGWL